MEREGGKGESGIKHALSVKSTLFWDLSMHAVLIGREIEKEREGRTRREEGEGEGTYAASEVDGLGWNG